VNYFSGLALNHDFPDLGLLSNWDYRCELLVASSLMFFFVYRSSHCDPANKSF
jgi:hypothetical protein